MSAKASRICSRPACSPISKSRCRAREADLLDVYFILQQQAGHPRAGVHRAPVRSAGRELRAAIYSLRKNDLLRRKQAGQGHGGAANPAQGQRIFQRPGIPAGQPGRGTFRLHHPLRHRLRPDRPHPANCRSASTTMQLAQASSPAISRTRSTTSTANSPRRSKKPGSC